MGVGLKICGFLFTFVIAISAFAAENRRACPIPSNEEPQTSRGEWRLIEKFDDMKTGYENLYASGKRIYGRAYWDESLGAYAFRGNDSAVKIDPVFLKHLTEQIEAILDRGYADFLFYPDLGHTHLYATLADSKNLQAIADSDRRAEAMFQLPELATMFHTAELIRLREGELFDGDLVDDPWLQWRYFSRNILGENKDGKNLQVLFAKGARYNTIRELEGYSQKTTIYLSASKDGCFAANTKNGVVYFDVSNR